MNKLLFFIVLMAAFPDASFAQRSTPKTSPLEVFKTADDFFANRKEKVGECYGMRGGKLTCNEGKIIDLEEGYFAFTWSGDDFIPSPNRRIIVHPKKKSFHVFMGGCRQLLFYMPAGTTIEGSFNERGDFIEGMAASDGGSPTFIWNADFTENTTNLEEAIGGKPEVLKKFKEERSTVSLRDWVNKRIYFYSKYVKLYCESEH